MSSKSQTAEAVAVLANGEAVVLTGRTLTLARKAAAEIDSLAAAKREIEARLAEQKEIAKALLDTAGSEVLTNKAGEVVLRRTTHTRSGVDAKRLEAERPEVFAEFRTESPVVTIKTK